MKDEEKSLMNRMVYNDEDNAPMIDDGRYPYRIRTLAEAEEEWNEKQGI